MSDVDDVQASVRLNNLELILTTFEQQKELAAMLEVEPSYLSRIKNKNVKFSRGKAAEIESALGLPYRWMEQVNAVLPAFRSRGDSGAVREPETSYEEQVLLTAYRGLPEQVRKALNVLIANLSHQKKGLDSWMTS